MARIAGPLPQASVEVLPVSLARLYRDLLRLHGEIRAGVRDARMKAHDFDLAAVADEGAAGEDRAFKLDLPADAVVRAFFSRPGTADAVVVAEGLGRASYHKTEGDPEWVVVVDPVDGTRELMFNKRPAWVLSGIAPNRDGVAVQDIALSLMTELPVDPRVKGRQAAAIAGSGEAWELAPQGRSAIRRRLRSSPMATVVDGWISLVSPFPGPCEVVGRVADRIARDVLGRTRRGQLHKQQIFLGQYCSTGGQMYELAAGYERMVADLRGELTSRGLNAGLCAKPYDLCAWVIPAEAGATITRSGSQPLNFPIDTTTDCSWVGYANSDIRAEIEPLLEAAVAAI